MVPDVSVYAPHGATSAGDPLFLNASAFTIPGLNSNGTFSTIGRFGDAGVGSVVGPRIGIVSMSLTQDSTYQRELETAIRHRSFEPVQSQEL